MSGPPPSTPPNTNDPLAPGQLLADRFRVVRRIAYGGMGVVYEAFDEKLGRPIAVKCARGGHDRRLSPEVRLATEISTPHKEWKRGCRCNRKRAHTHAPRAPPTKRRAGGPPRPAPLAGSPPGHRNQSPQHLQDLRNPHGANLRGPARVLHHGTPRRRNLVQPTRSRPLAPQG